MGKGNNNKMQTDKVPFIFSIRLRIIAGFLVPVIGILILGVSSYNKAASSIINAYREQTQQTAEVLDQYITLITETEKEEFKSYFAEQTLTYYFKDMLQKSDAISAKTTYNEALRDKLVRDSKISAVYMLSDSGKTLVGKTASVVDDAYSQFEKTSEGETVIANPYEWHLFGNDPVLDEATGMSGDYAIRWIRKFKDIPQVLVIDFNATEIRSALDILDAGDAGYVAIITTDGKEFFSDDSVTDTGVFYGQDFYKNAISSEDKSGNQMVKANGVSYLFVYSKIDDAGNMVAALIPQEDILTQTVDIQQMTTAITIIAAIVAVILALIITRQMAGTIKYILRKLDRVAAGDLTTHLEPKGRDEFALLCTGINNTVGNVKDLIKGVNDISDQVSEAAKNMAEASDTFKETSGDISKAAQRIEVGAGKLDTNSADCLCQMDTLSTQIKEVGTNADEIGRLTNQTGDTISEGIDSVEGLTKSATATSRITDEIIVAIKALDERSHAINEIVSAINGIAKQTNLLSLNASIEAARAGEAGRGFTVVATEIRDLSNECMNSANQISEIVAEITARTTEVVNIAGQASEIVSSQSAAVEQTKASFDKINDQVRGLIDALSIISDNVNVMNESREVTLKSIESISEISSETVNCSDEVNSATGTQTAAIDGLDAAAIQLEMKAGELIEMLGSFIVNETN